MPGRLHVVDDAAEQGELVPRGGLVLLAASEVGPQALEPEAGERDLAGERGGGLGREHTDAVHPGVDLHVHGRAGRRGGGQTLQAPR